MAKLRVNPDWESRQARKLAKAKNKAAIKGVRGQGKTNKAKAEGYENAADKRDKNAKHVADIRNAKVADPKSYSYKEGDKTTVNKTSNKTTNTSTSSSAKQQQAQQQLQLQKQKQASSNSNGSTPKLKVKTPPKGDDQQREKAPIKGKPRYGTNPPKKKKDDRGAELDKPNKNVGDGVRGGVTPKETLAKNKKVRGRIAPAKTKEVLKKVASYGIYE